MEDKLDLLAQDVLAKKELAPLGKEFALEKIKKHLLLNKKARAKLESVEYAKFQRSKEHELIIKAVREELRKIYGVFNVAHRQQRDLLLDEIKRDPSIENHRKILSLHKSSLERLPYYDIVYKQIFSLTGEPSSILDLACGLNPFSYPFLGCKPEYSCGDVSPEYMAFINSYFQALGINGKAMAIDLLREDIAEMTRGKSVVFLFKALDSLEVVKRHASKKLLADIASDFVAVSFATKSIGGGKAIRKERRAWFERLLSRLGKSFQTFEVPGEVFYIIDNRATL